MDTNEMAQEIIKLKDQDLAYRSRLLREGKLGEGYHPEMARVHLRNAEALDAIIASAGYPTPDKVGEEASEAAWLIIQHAIASPQFMRKCRRLLAEAVREGKSDPKHLAYLTDRIAMLEGKPQRYGTQFDWDENGMLSPSYFDDLNAVNRRRKALGFGTLEEQTELIRARAAREKQTPPAHPEKRKREFEEWRKKMGWTAGEGSS